MKKYVLILFMGFAVFHTNCNRKKMNSPEDDSPAKGTLHISVDESFKPVMEEQIRMYESSYPEAKIIASYKPEAECFRDFFTDSLTKMIFVTRGLTNKEDKFLHDSLNYYPAYAAVASDAVAIIVNKNSKDTLFTLKRLQQQLLGKENRNQTLVFDGLNATSTVRFITDSVLKGNNFDTSVVKAAANSNEVINYVSNNENAIGLIGINWIGNPEEPEQLEKLKHVKIAYVQCDLCEGKPFVKPMQENILNHRYPLVRGLYYILKENYMGLGTGFSSFLKFERGQLIFKRAYLGPVMDFELRNVKLNKKNTGN